MRPSLRLPASPVADPAAVVRGDHFRITVLTSGLLRLEYSPDGEFEDRASTFAQFRAQPVPEFRVIDTDHHVEVVTDRVQLVYDRGPFTTSGLSVQVLGNVSNYHSVWRFGAEPGVDILGPVDLGGTARTLDMADGAVPLEPGVLSRWGFAVLDDSGSMVFDDDGWVAPRTGERIDLYVFGYGRDYREAIQALYAVSGATPVLPRFSLGNWWSRYHAYTDAEYRELVERFRDEGIPLSVGVLDMDWHLVDIDPRHGSGWTGYTWNTELFPDPRGFLEWLHAKGLRVTLNVHPADGVRAHERVYAEMAAALGRDPADGAPIAFDVTDPGFLVAYLDVLHRSLEDDGVDFWWLDWQSGPYSRVTGIDPLWMLNHFHFLDSGRERDGVARRPMTFSRYAGPGSHRYPVGFSGDTLVTWASLDFQPAFTATASNIGYGWWSHDIGGHMFGVKDDELATRWVQFGVFSPISRLHSGSNPFATKEPSAFGPEHRAAMTNFLRLRHRLLPYLHTMNHRAAAGVPIVTPMYWWHPWAPESYRVPNQFMFGSELLVAPITTPRDPALGLGQVRAWLPPGDWWDVLSGLRYRGGREALLHRDLSTIPVLAPAGAIVPLDAAAVPDNGAANPAAFEVLVIAGADGSFEIVEDDGTGPGTDPERQWRTAISYAQQTGTVTVAPGVGLASCVPRARDWTITVLGVEASAGAGVSVTGTDGAPRVDAGAGRVSITVVDVPASAGFEVSIGPDPRPAVDDVPAWLFAMLDRARIEYELKVQIYELCCGPGSLAVRIGHLQALSLDRTLEAAVSEILLAAG